MDRQLFTARLQQKLLLSESAQCYHLEFTVDELSYFNFVAGQFVSCVAVDGRGKTQTRAYSVASAPDSLYIAAIWWPFGFILTITYFIYISRRYYGKVSVPRDNQGFY